MTASCKTKENTFNCIDHAFSLTNYWLFFAIFWNVLLKLLLQLLHPKSYRNILSGRCVACPWPQRIGAKKDRWWVGGYTQGSSTPPNVTLFHPMTIGSWFFRYIIKVAIHCRLEWNPIWRSKHTLYLTWRPEFNRGMAETRSMHKLQHSKSTTC